MLQTKLQQTFEKQKQSDLVQQLSQIPTFDQLLAKRDFTGAITLLNFYKSLDKSTPISKTAPQLVTKEELNQIDLWLAYCYFHNNEQATAEQIYRSLLERKDVPKETLQLFIAVCRLYQGDLDGALQIAQKLPKSPLQNRLCFHASARKLQEDNVIKYHKNLQNSAADQLALAAVHYLRTHFQQAIECYKQTNAEKGDWYSLCVFKSYCYYQLQDYQQALQELQTYRENVEDSVSSVNLLAAIEYKCGQSEKALKTLQLLKQCNQNIENTATYKHNNALYSLQEDNKDSIKTAINIIKPFQTQITEARSNLMYLYCKQMNYTEAYNDLKNFQPTVSVEYALKAAVCAFYGQDVSDPESLRYARAAYSMVAQSAADKDTVLGRLCAAAAALLDGDFEASSVNYQSIKDSYKIDQASYEINYGMSLSALTQDEEALPYLQKNVNDQRFTIVHKQWLGRILVRQGRYNEVFDMLKTVENQQNIRCITLFRLLAHEFFAVNEFDSAIQMCKRGIECCGNVEEFSKLQQELYTIKTAAQAGKQLRQRGKKVQSPEMIDEELSE